MILTWLASAASPRPEPAIQTPLQSAQAAPSARAAPDTASALAFDVEREAQRLRLRVADTPAPRRSGRDPFRFQEQRAPEPPHLARNAAGLAALAEVTTAPAEVTPALKLIGIAERATADGFVRSAVLSGPADVFIVGVDDQVLDRFTVVAIAAEAVELADATTGRSLRLAMR
jgi:hypothetical protein